MPRRESPGTFAALVRYAGVTRASSPRIVLAGATGALGGRIAQALRERGADVTALVRPGTTAERVAPLRACGVVLAKVGLGDIDALAKACAGAECVVSALNGLDATMLGDQGTLLKAAVRAGVPRFVPSDFSIDFTVLPPGSNRNLDLRRSFHEVLEAAPIRATSIYTGAFADLLVGPMPLVLFPLKRVLYFGEAAVAPDLPLDFTTMDDTADFTTAVALDDEAPRTLRIAGARLSVRDLAAMMSGLSGKPYRLLRAGSLKRLEAFIAITRRVYPAAGKVFPPWQGMQYLRNMFDGAASRLPLDNARYPDLTWTDLRNVLATKI